MTHHTATNILKIKFQVATASIRFCLSKVMRLHNLICKGMEVLGQDFVAQRKDEILNIKI